MPPACERVRAWPLVAAGVGLEVLALCGVVPSDPGIVHGVGLPPLDLTYDMTLLLSRATTPAWFAIGLVLSITARAVVLALMLGSIRRWWFALRFELLCMVPAYLSAEASYAGRAMLYAAVYWTGIVLAVAFAFLLAHLPWESTRTLREALKLGFTRGPRTPTVALYIAALGALGGLLHGDGSPFALLAVLLSVTLTVTTTRRLRRIPDSPAASRATAVIIIALVVALVFVPPEPSSTSVAAPRRGGELLVVAGIDTSSGHGSIFRLRPSQLGFSCDQTYYFSYRGPGRGAEQGEATCPISSGSRYSRADTQRPLRLSVRAFEDELNALRPPVTVVTHSSGAWVAWAALAEDRASPANDLVMIAPLTDPAGYPPFGHDGTAVVGAAGMRLLTTIGQSIGFSQFDPDRPLARELLGSKNAAAALFGRTPAKPLRSLSLPGALDVTFFDNRAGAPFPHSLAGCALIESHTATATSPSAMRQADAFLNGASAVRCGTVPGWIADTGDAFATP